MGTVLILPVSTASARKKTACTRALEVSVCSEARQSWEFEARYRGYVNVSFNCKPSSLSTTVLSIRARITTFTEV